jgi:site-specific DNA-cytosine methylase
MRKINKLIRENDETHPTIDANYYKGPSHQRPGLAVIQDNPSGGGKSLDNKHNWDTYMINGKIRRLTPTECERLMSWPDGWTKYGINEKGEKVEISDSQRYKMCGNGVVSKVVEEVFKNIICKK